MMTSAIDQAQNFFDLKGLNDIRLQSKAHDQDSKQQALERVAKQFEGIFMQMLLKSMRQAEDVLASDSPFNSQTTKFYRDMHDQQLALEMSKQGSLGLAPLIVRQLGGDQAHYTPKSALPVQGLSPLLQQKIERNPLLDKLQTTAEPDAANVRVSIEKSATIPRYIQQPERQQQSTMGANERFDSPEAFVQSLIEPAKLVEQQLGVPYQVVIAQSALETGWGQKIITKSNGESSNNLFNIKADSRWQGDKVTKQTLEFEQGAMVKKSAPFRVYQSLKDSVADYIDFLSDNPRYQQALQQKDNVEQFLQGLQSAGYATDPNYAAKIMKTLGKVSQLLAQ
jgi:flagellar protein FlgJ